MKSWILLQRLLNSSPQQQRGSSFVWVLLGLLFLLIGLVALPSLMPQPHGNKVGWKWYVNSINHGQQYYFEDNSRFASRLEDLGLGLQNPNGPYYYDIQTIAASTIVYAIPQARRNSLGPMHWQQKPNLKSYVGGVFISHTTKYDLLANPQKWATTSILCEARNPEVTKLASPTYQEGKLACGDDSIQVPTPNR